MAQKRASQQLVDLDQNTLSSMSGVNHGSSDFSRSPRCAPQSLANGLSADKGKATRRPAAVPTQSQKQHETTVILDSEDEDDDDALVFVSASNTSIKSGQGKAPIAQAVETAARISHSSSVGASRQNGSTSQHTSRVFSLEQQKTVRARIGPLAPSSSSADQSHTRTVDTSQESIGIDLKLEDLFTSPARNQSNGHISESPPVQPTQPFPQPPTEPSTSQMTFQTAAQTQTEFATSPRLTPDIDVDVDIDVGQETLRPTSTTRIPSDTVIPNTSSLQDVLAPASPPLPRARSPVASSSRQTIEDMDIDVQTNQFILPESHQANSGLLDHSQTGPSNSLPQLNINPPRLIAKARALPRHLAPKVPAPRKQPKRKPQKPLPPIQFELEVSAPEKALRADCLTLAGVDPDPILERKRKRRKEEAERPPPELKRAAQLPFKTPLIPSGIKSDISPVQLADTFVPMVQAARLSEKALLAIRRKLDPSFVQTSPVKPGTGVLLTSPRKERRGLKRNQSSLLLQTKSNKKKSAKHHKITSKNKGKGKAKAEDVTPADSDVEDLKEPHWDDLSDEETTCPHRACSPNPDDDGSEPRPVTARTPGRRGCSSKRGPITITKFRKPPIERILIDPGLDQSSLAVLRKDMKISLKGPRIVERTKQITFDGLAEDMEFVFDQPETDSEDEQVKKKKKSTATKSTSARAGYVHSGKPWWMNHFKGQLVPEPEAVEPAEAPAASLKPPQSRSRPRSSLSREISVCLPEVEPVPEQTMLPSPAETEFGSRSQQNNGFQLGQPVQEVKMEIATESVQQLDDSVLV